MLSSQPLLLTFLIFSIFPSSQSQTSPYRCDKSSPFFVFKSRTFTTNLTSCKNLPTLGFDFGWNLHNTTNKSTNPLVDIVFSSPPPTPTGWITWGVNPGPKPRMVGTRAIIAVGQPGGAATVGTYNVTEYTKTGCRLENSTVDIGVEKMGSAYDGSTNMMTVWAQLRLPSSGGYNVSMLNVVWQVGGKADGVVPLVHRMRLENFDSFMTINLTSGAVWNAGHEKKRTRLRIAHGVMSSVAWGFLLPIGVLGARYMRTAPWNPKWWLYVHASIQITAYIIGTSAWSIGLYIVPHYAHYKPFMAHRAIGILIFLLATLQITALWIKPDPHTEPRKNWRVAHHFVGYLLVALTIANIFKGFAILRPPHDWKVSYIVILAGLAFAALVLESTVWLQKWLRRGIAASRTNQIEDGNVASQTKQKQVGNAASDNEQKQDGNAASASEHEQKQDENQDGNAASASEHEQKEDGNTASDDKQKDGNAASEDKQKEDGNAALEKEGKEDERTAKPEPAKGSRSQPEIVICSEIVLRAEESSEHDQ